LESYLAIGHNMPFYLFSFFIICYRVKDYPKPAIDSRVSVPLLFLYYSHALPR